MQSLVLNFSNKKESLYATINSSKIKISNKFLILNLIESGRLDDMIDKISDDIVIVLKSPLVPDGFLSSYEQFISILDNFISYTLNIIQSFELLEEIVLNCLDNSDILLSKKYYYDSENIEFYRLKFNTLIINIFYKNLLMLKGDIKEELDFINLNVDKIDIYVCNDNMYLINILEEIVLVNKNDYKIMALFRIVDDDKYDMYVDWYKMLLSRYIENIEFIYRYREFKEKSCL